LIKLKKKHLISRVFDQKCASFAFFPIISFLNFPFKMVLVTKYVLSAARW